MNSVHVYDKCLEKHMQRLGSGYSKTHSSDANHSPAGGYEKSQKTECIALLYEVLQNAFSQKNQ